MDSPTFNPGTSSDNITSAGTFANHSWPLGIPETLRQQQRWLRWAVGTRRGKETKIPYIIGAKGCAKATDPSTWRPFSSAMNCQLSNAHGVGIALGDLGNGFHLCGFDKDSSRGADGLIASWAGPVAEFLAERTYVEVSPSGLGLKAFFLASADDAADLKQAFGIKVKQWGCRRWLRGR